MKWLLNCVACGRDAEADEKPGRLPKCGHCNGSLLVTGTEKTPEERQEEREEKRFMSEGTVMYEAKDMTRVERLGELYDLSVKVLRDYLSGKEVPQTRVEAARITVAQWAKVRQTDNAARALNFAMARELATDRDQLEKYVHATMPMSAIARALPAPANGTAK